MIPAYITFIVDNTRNNNANNKSIADDIEMSSINGNDDDEYLIHYDKDLNKQDITTNNVMQDVITNLDDENVDDDDTTGKIAIIRTPEYNESSRMMMMLTDGFEFVESSKKEDYCYMNINTNNFNFNINSNNNCNYNNNYNYNNNSNNNTNANTNIIDYECGSLFEDYDDVMFPSDTIITLD